MIKKKAVFSRVRVEGGATALGRKRSRTSLIGPKWWEIPEVYVSPDGFFNWENPRLYEKHIRTFQYCFIGCGQVAIHDVRSSKSTEIQLLRHFEHLICQCTSYQQLELSIVYNPGSHLVNRLLQHFFFLWPRLQFHFLSAAPSTLTLFTVSQTQKRNTREKWAAPGRVIKW